MNMLRAILTSGVDRGCTTAAVYRDADWPQAAVVRVYLVISHAAFSYVVTALLIRLRYICFVCLSNRCREHSINRPGTERFAGHSAH
jgi:hypothetical protein